METFWLVLRKTKTIFCVLFVKFKVAVKIIIFWCSVWALTYRNDFYYLDVIEFKRYSATTRISVLFNNLGCIFPKISMAYNLDETVERQEKRLFQRKSPSPHKSVLFARFWTSAKKTLSDSKSWTSDNKTLAYSTILIIFLKTFHFVYISCLLLRLYRTFVDILLFIRSFDKNKSILMNKISICLYWHHMIELDFLDFIV